MKKVTRRAIIKAAALGLAVPALSDLAYPMPQLDKKQGSARGVKFVLGMASYTFREFSLDDAIIMTKRLGLGRIALKDFHLALNSRPDEIAAAAAKVRDAGLDLYGCGVVYMKTEADVGQAFEYAKAAGMSTIIGVPHNELLSLVNRKVREYDIKLAVHNHGPEDLLYPTPRSVFEKVRGLDPRIGLCLDIGHTMRSGVEPSEAAEKYAGKLLDVHIKDVSSATKEGTTVEIGRGVIDIPRFLRTLIKIGYAGTVSLEYEKDGKDPLAGAAESVGYIRGVLALLGGGK
jgi:sugar phosphate isomerase/epimerase